MKKNFELVLLVLLLILGMTVIGCDFDLPGDGTDKSLDGTWISGDDDASFELTLNNGNLEGVMVVSGVRTPQYKGTYTADGSKITLTLTHLYGGGILYYLTFNSLFTDLAPLDAKTWYTKAEIRQKIEESDPKTTGDYSIAIANFDELFRPITHGYSIDGNTLTLLFEDGDSDTYTRKNQ